jgi:dihydrofolate reductase
MAISADGYIAKENGEAPWSDAEWRSFSQTVQQHGNLVIGRKTFEIMEKSKEFEKIGTPFVVVVSKKKRKSIGGTFVTSPKEAIQILKKKGFTKVLVGGGGKINASFMKANLIDKLILDIEPQIFGKGINLFRDETFGVKLKLLGTKKISEDVLQVQYEVIRK